MFQVQDMGSGDMLVWPNFVGDFDSAGSGPRQFSTSVAGDTPHSDN